MEGRKTVCYVCVCVSVFVCMCVPRREQVSNSCDDEQKVEGLLSCKKISEKLTRTSPPV